MNVHVFSLSLHLSHQAVATFLPTYAQLNFREYSAGCTLLDCRAVDGSPHACPVFFGNLQTGLLEPIFS